MGRSFCPLGPLFALCSAGSWGLECSCDVDAAVAGMIGIVVAHVAIDMGSIWCKLMA